MKEDNIVIVIIVLCVTILESVALATGVDGQAFSTAIAALVGLAGLAVGYKFHKHKTK